MDKKVILLATTWSPDYWEYNRKAPYPKTTYKELTD